MALAMKNQPSEFVQSALELEEVFASIEGLAGSLDRLELNSEAGLERAKKLLVRLTERSQGLQGALETLLRTLETRRSSVEDAVATVNAKTPLIAEKFQEAEDKLERFQQLGVRVKELTAEAPHLPSEEVRKRLQELTAEAGAVQEAARLGKLRSLEKNAQNLRSSLKALSRKLA